jgi:ParB family chromosome partitioning protein
MAGERQLPFQDHLGSLIGIDMAQWWRPTAANYFDRVSKQVILDALTDVGGLELSSRFASVKKGDLAMSAERVFAGTYITEVEVREKALAWVPEVMRFALRCRRLAKPRSTPPTLSPVTNDEISPPASWPPDLLLTGSATRTSRSGPSAYAGGPLPFWKQSGGGSGSLWH